MSEPAMEDAAAGSRRRWLDWRIWIGLVIAGVSIWWAMRDVPYADVLAAMGEADLLLLLALSLPAHVASVYFRALRWRHLTNPLAPISRASLFGAASIGFMVNNLVPLRIGEVVRSWYLARENGLSASSVLGTVVLERILDVVSVVLLAVGSLALLGANSAEAGLLRQGALLLLPVAIAPLVALVVLRMAPEPVISLAAYFMRPLPPRISRRLVTALRSFVNGLGALSGGSHLFWIVAHSVTIWLIISVIPILAGILAFGIDLGSPIEMLTTCWIVLGAVGVAVAIPSAPGFFGPYQLAFKAVLTRFGVEPATALALGLLVWFVFWVTLTAQGFIVLRTRGTTLGELTQRSGKDPSSDRR